MNPIKKWAAPALLVTLLTTGACASPSGEDSGGERTDSRSVAEPEGAAPTEAGAADSQALNEKGGSGEQEADRAIINTGEVTLRSGDVAKARADAQKVIDRHDGQIADEETYADGDGSLSSTRVELRVPAKEFDDVMTDLGEVAELRETSRTSEDVTTQVIDNNVRVRAQEKSLKRIEVLLARAETVQEIVSIESELTERQSELDSLKQRQSYLRDQTAQSTITLDIETDYDDKSTKDGEDHNAFVAGLLGGWNALKDVGGGLAAVVGALLPFAIVATLIGVPLMILLRRLGKRFGKRLGKRLGKRVGMGPGTDRGDATVQPDA
ncbi:MAG: DUF4349 domain-containing protein [Nocardioides sp.]|nr:DUF4349 domain-containing protein [Nocardioides sp.]